jgi:hypothetical protein
LVIEQLSFNSSLQGNYLILTTVLRLKKNGIPKLGYRELLEIFNRKEQPNSSMKSVRPVIAIRRKKLPDPEANWERAGLVFKNFFIAPQEFETIVSKISHVHLSGSCSISQIRALRSPPSRRTLPWLKFRRPY